MAKTTLFKRAAAYRKKHPGLSMPQAVRAISGITKTVTTQVKKVSGIKRRARRGAKKIGMLAPVCGTACSTRARKIGSVKRKQTGVQKAGKKLALQVARQIANRIDHLEAIRKEVHGQQMKNIYALAINKEHKKLDAIERRLKAS